MEQGRSGRRSSLLTPQIVEYGGAVVIQPDTAVTHVIWDQGTSASGLAKKLGLQTLSELPEGTICVKWDWIVKCQMTVSAAVLKRGVLMTGPSLGREAIPNLPVNDLVEATGRPGNEEPDVGYHPQDGRPFQGRQEVIPDRSRPARTNPQEI